MLNIPTAELKALLGAKAVAIWKSVAVHVEGEGGMTRVLYSRERTRLWGAGLIGQKIFFRSYFRQIRSPGDKVQTYGTASVTFSPSKPFKRSSGPVRNGVASAQTAEASARAPAASQASQPSLCEAQSGGTVRPPKWQRVAA